MAQPLTSEQLRDALASLPGWAFADDRISKAFTFRHFREAMSFIVRLSYEAEAMNHHPELTNVYNTVTIRLNTHDAGGKVTQNDIDLAQAIERFNWTA